MAITINAHPHPGQAEVHKHPARFKVLAAGRRWGKTRLGVNECLDVASKGGRAWWIAPSYKMSEVGWRPIRRMGGNIKADVRIVDRMVILPGGGYVQVRSADDPNSLRGEGLDFVVMDECAFMKQEAWTEAIRPSLSDRQGKALFISTPKGHNWFWQNYQRGQDGGEWAAFSFPTRTNPYIPEGEIEAAKQTLPERVFLQEYEAVFLDDAGGVFRRVAEAATAKQLDEAQEGRQYIAGVDVATLVDYTVVSVFDVASKEQVYMDRFNRCDFDVLEDRLHALYKRFKMSSMTVEVNSIGQSVIESLVKKNMSVIPFTTTNATKQTAIQDLQSAFEHGEICILPDPIQVGELQSFEGVKNPNGSWKYEAPEGMHDDTVMAMAIAWQGFNNWWFT